MPLLAGASLLKARRLARHSAPNRGAHPPRTASTPGGGLVFARPRWTKPRHEASRVNARLVWRGQFAMTKLRECEALSAHHADGLVPGRPLAWRVLMPSTVPGATE